MLDVVSMSHLSEQDLHELRRSLEHEREALQAMLDATRAESHAVPAGENDQVDIAERMIEQADGLRLARFDGKLLADVQRAIAKMEAGTYGTSEDSGAPIPLARLRAVPWARRTMAEEARRQR